jgi:hypothetical protein
MTACSFASGIEEHSRGESDNSVANPTFVSSRIAIVKSRAPDMTLSEVIQQLQANNICCGLQTQLGGAIQAWVGDDVRGITVKQFSASDADQIGQWLEATSRQRYPQASHGAFKLAQATVFNRID